MNLSELTMYEIAELLKIIIGSSSFGIGEDGICQVRKANELLAEVSRRQIEYQIEKAKRKPGS